MLAPEIVDRVQRRSHDPAGSHDPTVCATGGLPVPASPTRLTAPNRTGPTATGDLKYGAGSTFISSPATTAPNACAPRGRPMRPIGSGGLFACPRKIRGEEEQESDGLR